MMLDNSCIQHVKLLKDCLGDTPRLQLVFLPPCSSKLNLLEGVWKWLKDNIINNTFYPMVKEIKSVVQNFINYINTCNQRVIDRLCIKL